MYNLSDNIILRYVSAFRIFLEDVSLLIEQLNVVLMQLCCCCLIRKYAVLWVL